MSILIKGMKMPKYCNVCPFEMERKTRDGDGITYCVITREAVRWWMNDRHESSYGKCPLVELPPHGRLIDADAFSTKILEIVERQKYDDFYAKSLSVGAILREVVNELRGVGLDGFGNAPTIIEAEETE